MSPGCGLRSGDIVWLGWASGHIRPLQDTILPLDSGHWTSAADDQSAKLYNHGEGPYLGLLLVESSYYHFHI